jgi:hypothetical protein
MTVHFATVSRPPGDGSRADANGGRNGTDYSVAAPDGAVVPGNTQRTMGAMHRERPVAGLMSHRRTTCGGRTTIPSSRVDAICGCVSRLMQARRRPLRRIGRLISVSVNNRLLVTVSTSLMRADHPW